MLEREIEERRKEGRESEEGERVRDVINITSPKWRGGEGLGASARRSLSLLRGRPVSRMEPN